jgi:hypothetical protein
MSLESWTAHQTAKGLREYGAPLSASGLTVAQLLQHAACEAADLVAYLRAASDQTDNPDVFAALADACMLGRLVCELAGPAPEFVAPPMCPTPDAVRAHGRFWWRRDEVVKVTIYRGSEIWYGPAGVAWSALVDPSDDWSGPVVARRRSVLPVAP